MIIFVVVWKLKTLAVLGSKGSSVTEGSRGIRSSEGYQFYIKSG